LTEEPVSIGILPRRAAGALPLAAAPPGAPTAPTSVTSVGLRPPSVTDAKKHSLIIRVLGCRRQADSLPRTDQIGRLGHDSAPASLRSDEGGRFHRNGWPVFTGIRIKKDIEGRGFSSYLDMVEDAKLRESGISKNTKTLRVRMRQCASLVFVISKGSSSSKWMPWELGYYDGHSGKTAILPIGDDPRLVWHKGQEYLDLYPFVTFGPNNRDDDRLWVIDPEDYENDQDYRSWLGAR
jgi:hypothetical protein